MVVEIVQNIARRLKGAFISVVNLVVYEKKSRYLVDDY